jgi:hypothetical protein
MRSLLTFGTLSILFFEILISIPANAYGFSAFQQDSTKGNSDTTDNSTTFFHYQYSENYLNENIYIYKNFGALLYYSFSPSIVQHTGFEQYYSLVTIPDINYIPPFSYIKYLKGSKNEQAFSAGFSQNVFRNFIIDGKIRTITGDGFFNNQSAKIQNYAAGVLYLSDDSSYSFDISYKPAIVTNGMNGGIINDSTILSINNNQGKSLPVFFNDAQARFKEKLLQLNQRLIFFNTGNQIHSITYSLKHILELNSQKYIYTATLDQSYYRNTFADSTATNDVSHFSVLHNELRPEISIKQANDEIRFDIIGGIENVKNKFVDSVITSCMYSYGTSAGFINNDWKSDFIFVRKEGDLNETVYMALNLRRSIKGFINAIGLDAVYSVDEPSLIMQYYSSNHFKWSNKFDNITSHNASLWCASRLKLISLRVKNEVIKQFVYFDYNALPQQYSGNINVMSANALLNLPIYKNWSFYSDTKLQKSDNFRYSVPDLYLYTAIYYESNVFKKAMKVSTGAGCLYFSSYYSNILMPATSQFYLQKKETIGDYPYLDFFVNFRIKTVKFFLRLEHINSGLNNKLYLYQPGQPSPGRTIKIGIDWTFNESYTNKR